LHHDLVVHDDDTQVAAAAAGLVAAAARSAVTATGTFHLAVSGGSTPWEMFAVLADLDMPWEQVVIHQVDERIAPADDPDRNLGHLMASLDGAPATVVPMPVELADPDEAAREYAAQLPEAFDLIHLGLGPDGHTASLVPGDAVVDVTDRLVAPTAGEYQDRRRLTLTYPALARTRHLLWLVTGAMKRVPLAQLLDGDTTIPAGRVEAPASTVMADRLAAGGRGGSGSPR